MKSRCSKLYLAHSISFTSSNVGKPFLELNSKRLYQSSGREKESCRLMFLMSSTKRKFRHFHVATRAKKCTKERDAHANLLFCQSKPPAIAFLPSRSRRRRLQKRPLKSEFALLQTLSRLFQLVQFVKCWQIFLELNSKRLSKVRKRKRKSLSFVHVLDKRWN